MRAMLIMLAALAALAATAVLGACQPVRPAPHLTVTPAKGEDQWQVSWAGGDAAIDLYSANGIGAATIAWPEQAPGSALLLRLHLKGLEGLQVTAGDQQAALAVDNAPPYTVRAEDAANPAALDIAIDRSDGVFTVRLGESWLQAGELTVQWVDFYR